MSLELEMDFKNKQDLHFCLQFVNLNIIDLKEIVLDFSLRIILGSLGWGRKHTTHPMFFFFPSSFLMKPIIDLQFWGPFLIVIENGLGLELALLLDFIFTCNGSSWLVIDFILNSCFQVMS